MFPQPDQDFGPQSLFLPLPPYTATGNPSHGYSSGGGRVVHYGFQEGLARSFRGNLDFYFPHLPIVTGEGFDHHAHGPVVPLDMTVLQQHEVHFLHIGSL